MDCDRWEISMEDAIGMRYGFPAEHPIKNKRMYLTDWQMRKLRDEAGMTCDFVELKKEIPISKYKVVHPDSTKI